MVAAGIRRLRGTPVVMNVQDIVPDAPIMFGMMKNSIQIGLFRWIERKSYAGSDRIIVISDSFATNLRSKGVAPEKLSVIRNWVDTEEVRPLDRMNTFRRDHGIGAEAFVVMYAGNMGQSQGLEIVLDAAHRLRSKANTVFVLVGGGASLRDLKSQAARMRLLNVRFMPTYHL
jgi:colanic acid biosynthesis glycosyl transferase WcaI